MELIYEDEDILICRKPAGIATQTRRLGQQDMESLLKNERVKKGEPPYLGIVHRLDQPVEGIMVFAKNPKAAAGLSAQIQKHMFGKHYYAMTAHPPKASEGRLTDYLRTDKKANYTYVEEGTPEEIAKRYPEAKKAILDYRVVANREERVLLDILLHTGRQHQIRVQMAHMGCPLLGDEKYGIREAQRQPLALCAYRLEFLHPITGKKMDFAIKPEWDFFKT